MTDRTWVIVLAADGRNFSAGHDIADTVEQYQQAMQDYINAIRSISWWRAKYGPILDAAKLADR